MPHPVRAELPEAPEATQALHETRMAAFLARISDLFSSYAKLQAEVESRSEMLAQITQFKQHLDQVQSSLEQEMSGKQALIQAHALKLWNANSERNMLKLTLRDIYTKLQKAEQRERRMKKYFFWKLIRPFEKLKN